MKMKCKKSFVFSLDGSRLGIPEFRIKKLYQDQVYRNVASCYCNFIANVLGIMYEAMQKVYIECLYDKLENQDSHRSIVYFLQYNDLIVLT